VNCWKRNVIQRVLIKSEEPALSPVAPLVSFAAVGPPGGSSRGRSSCSRTSPLRAAWIFSTIAAIAASLPTGSTERGSVGPHERSGGDESDGLHRAAEAVACLISHTEFCIERGLDVEIFFAEGELRDSVPHD
jgi:hypothetical protein